MKTLLLVITLIAAFTATTVYAQDALTDGERIARIEGAYQHLSTKSDVESLRGDTKSEIAALRGDMLAGFEELSGKLDKIEEKIEKDIAKSESNLLKWFVASMIAAAGVIAPTTSEIARKFIR